MATCGDCFYAYVDHGTWRCKKKFGKIDFDDSLGSPENIA